MKKLFGQKDTKDPSPVAPTVTTYTSGTTTGERTTTDSTGMEPEPTVTYERTIVEEQPLRHESVRGGIKETLKHPIEALKGHPRDRSPTEIRRREYTEREIVPREGAPRKEYRVIDSMEGLSVEDKPRSAKDLRSEFRTGPTYTREVREDVHEEPKEKGGKEDIRYSTREKEVKEDIIVETREKGPVVKEHILPKEREEIQPVIHREREKTEVIEVTKPIIEREVMPTKITETTLPPETRATVYHEESEDFKQRYKKISEKYKPSFEVAATEKEVIERTPIVKEHVTKKVIQEIQPVIFREITEPHITREVKPIYEKVVEEPTLVEKGEMPPEEYRGYKERERSKEFKERERSQDLKEKERSKEFKESSHSSKGEPEFREYYNEKGELIREYRYYEGEAPKGHHKRYDRDTTKRVEVHRGTDIPVSSSSESRG